MTRNLSKTLVRAHGWYIVIAVIVMAVLVSIRVFRTSDVSLYFNIDVYIEYVTHPLNLLLYVLVVSAFVLLALARKSGRSAGE